MSGYREVGPICPFMSTDTQTAPFVCCQREKCAAWGPIEPLWILEREGGETREYYVTWLKGRWRKIPKNRDHELTLCGCRRLGGEVPE